MATKNTELRLTIQAGSPPALAVLVFQETVNGHRPKLSVGRLR